MADAVSSSKALDDECKSQPEGRSLRTLSSASLGRSESLTPQESRAGSSIAAEAFDERPLNDLQERGKSEV